MIDLEISNFSGSYSHLNSIKKTNVCRMNNFARCVMTAGHRNLNSYRRNSYHNKLKLYHLAFECVKQNRVTSKLQLTDDFFKLETSDKVTSSYYLGSGLTKLVAEELLSVRWIVHLRHNPWAHTLYATRIPAKFTYKGSIYSKGSIPDFIAIDSANKYHVLESKASSGTLSIDTMQKGINQVSQVRFINGVPPETKVVCGFSMSKSSIKGLIVDPTDSGGSDVILDFNNFIIDYYSYFHELTNRKTLTTEIHGRKFLIEKLDDINSYYGVDAELLKLISNNEFDSNQINKYLSNFELVNDEVYSIGLDGIILVNEEPHSDNI